MVRVTRAAIVIPSQPLFNHSTLTTAVWTVGWILVVKGSNHDIWKGEKDKSLAQSPMAVTQSHRREISINKNIHRKEFRSLGVSDRMEMRDHAQAWMVCTLPHTFP